MDHQEFATSHVKKKRMKHSPFNLDLMLQMRFVDFNLNPYTSLDEWLRLNHFKRFADEQECATYPFTYVMIDDRD